MGPNARKKFYEIAAQADDLVECLSVGDDAPLESGQKQVFASDIPGKAVWLYRWLKKALAGREQTQQWAEAWEKLSEFGEKCEKLCRVHAKAIERGQFIRLEPDFALGYQGLAEALRQAARTATGKGFPVNLDGDEDDEDEDDVLATDKQPLRPVARRAKVGAGRSDLR